MRTQLSTNDPYGKLVLDYIEANASDELVAKINAGTKTIDNCMAFIKGEAKKKAVAGVAMVEDKEVYGWAIHFFEEDGIKAEAVKPNNVVPMPKREPEQAKKPEPKKEAPKSDGQMSIFELMGV